MYDHQDSTVSYAVQLAMRDKEDQLVDTALERIRRAQMLGKKNVKLSKRELDALERRRQQNESNAGPSRRSRAGSTTSTRPSSRRNGHTVPSEEFVGAYPPFAPGRPPSSSSNRPRTPTMQSLRPQSSSSNSPLRAAYPGYANHVPPTARPQSMQQPVYPRPLPDDPQWAPPPYYNSMQMNPYLSDQAPYQPQLPTDLRVGSQSRVSYPTGAPPVEMPSPPGRRQSISSRQSQPRARAETPEEDSEVSSEEESSSEDSDVQIVGVVERQAPGLQRRPVASGTRRTRGSR